MEEPLTIGKLAVLCDGQPLLIKGGLRLFENQLLFM